MAAFGPDFQKYTSPFLYEPINPAGLWRGLGFLLLIGGAYMVLQSIVGLAISIFGFQMQWNDPSAIIKASIIGVLPASIPIAAFVWWVSKFRGGVPRDVLALRLAHLGWLGWPIVVFGFIIVMYAVVIAIVYIFQIDLSQFQMGADGEMEAQDLVKQGMIELAREPMLYWLAFLSVAVGAPIGEELIFRGICFRCCPKPVLALRERRFSRRRFGPFCIREPGRGFFPVCCLLWGSFYAACSSALAVFG
jgi:membrane protease YdiL (CAAX protease family)